MERLKKDIEGLITVNSVPVEGCKVREGNQKDGYCCPTGDWEDYEPDRAWRSLNSYRWLRTTITIPEEMDNRHVEFRITTGREGQWDATNPQMLFYINGEIIQGVDVNHREVTIAQSAKAGEGYDIAMLMYSGSVPGDLVIKTELVVIDDRVKKLYYDMLIPLQSAKLIKHTDEDSYMKILKLLQSAADTLDLRRAYSESFYDSISRAEDILYNNFYSRENNTCPVVSAIGHTHIDIAWLWTVAQTREKAVRSFSTVLRLMDQYPEYKFMSSQPLLYQYVKEKAPELYSKIRQRVKEGRWEVDGAMWLEADCNVTGGESLVRQILKGHKFIKDEFGCESSCLWLPDAFGYSAALPQILKKSRIPYFMTTKIAWNQYNQLPNDTFMWKGIDGSQVFVFMPTTCDYEKNAGLNISFSDTRNTTTYTGIVNPNMTLGTYKRFQNKDLTEDTIMLFGFGDGGGGPTKEMLESAERLKYGIPGIPRIKQEFERDFFDRTYNKIAGLPQMPTWNGELYFEYHRGTLTSMAKNKKFNRKNELLYTQLETASCMAGEQEYTYPQEAIEKGWDVLLQNQFHDILPGTCIEQVYDQTDREYDEIEKTGEYELRRAACAAARHVDTENNSIVVVNTQGYNRNDVVEVKGLEDRSIAYITDEQGTCYDVQKTEAGEYIFFAENIPSMGVKAYKYVPGKGTEQKKSSWDGSFENDYLKVKFNDQMEIVSLFEKSTEKELIMEGERGNRLLTYEDRPMNWDNWDIDVYYKRKSYEKDWCSKPEIVEDGPVRLVLEYRFGFQESVICQRVILYRNMPRIDFATKADWREHHVLLRVDFPVDINTTRAAYEIQFGNVERETTCNNSWDSAKFETCGHKWADMSENNCGISLMNDCKYGYGIKNGHMSLTLIKSGTYPNKNADIGKHEFIYSIYPHAGRWQDAETVEQAYNLNVPLVSVLQDKNKAVSPLNNNSFLSCNKDNCFIEVVKKSEDGNGLIVRMYENKNSQVKAKLTAGRPLKEAYECNLLEENENKLNVDECAFECIFKPYEIKTFRIVF
jgi:alpha-mannosidase